MIRVFLFLFFLFLIGPFGCIGTLFGSNLSDDSNPEKVFSLAEKYIDQYYATFPDKNKLEDSQLAEIYVKQGNFDKACIVHDTGHRME